jgi:very-short-patch-repair endonuclease
MQPEQDNSDLLNKLPPSVTLRAKQHVAPQGVPFIPNVPMKPYKFARHKPAPVPPPNYPTLSMSAQQLTKHRLFRSKLIHRATHQERIFKEYLIASKIPFVFQKGFLRPFYRIVDFYLPTRQIIVEIDGQYHDHVNTAKSDAHKDLRWQQFPTLRILNRQVENGDFKTILSNFMAANNPPLL